MNATHREYFRTAYPGIFVRDEENHMFYWDVGDGWFHLLDELCRDIVSYCAERGIYQPTCAQLKEKFGTLRFYMDPSPDDHSQEDRDRFHELIQRAEHASSVTCDVCGLSGKMLHDGWIRVRCEEHING